MPEPAQMDYNYNDISILEATQIQNELKQQIILRSEGTPIRSIGGADISFNKYSSTVYAGIVVLSYPGLVPISYALATMEVNFPYVPGYLAFREVPPLFKAWNNLPQKPDVLVLDGHGIAHPRRMGVASHFGVLANHPTLGCAKTLLFGKHSEPGMQQGAVCPIEDKNEQIGWALRTKRATAPIYVSPGYKLSMAESLTIVRHCLGKYRIPEPTRHAHAIVNKFRLGELGAGFHSFAQIAVPNLFQQEQ